MSDKKKNITLFALLADKSQLDSRKFLKRHGQGDARNSQELEYKLAKFYHEHPDKVQLEKEFVEIHPHKDFILKYTAPKEQPKTEVVKQVVLRENTAGADGSESNQCSCSKCTSNACGCQSSSFDGTNSSNARPIVISNELIIFGIIGVVAIAGMVIYTHKKT